MMFLPVLANTLLLAAVVAQHSQATPAGRSPKVLAPLVSQRLAVILKFADGKPWSSARVYAQAGFAAPGWVLPGSPHAEGTSDANGRCALSIASCTDHWLWAESEAEDGTRWVADAVPVRSERAVRLVARPKPVAPTILRFSGLSDRCAKVRVRDRSLGWERVFEAPSTELRLATPPSQWIEVVTFDSEGRPGLLCDVRNDGETHVLEPESSREQELVIESRPQEVDPTELRLQLWHRGEVFDLAAFDEDGRARFDFDRWQALVDGRGQCANRWGSAYVVNGEAIEPMVVDLVWAEYRRPDSSQPIPLQLKPRERTGAWFRFRLGGEELTGASLRHAVELETAHGERKQPIRFTLDSSLAGRPVPLSMGLKDLPYWLTGATLSKASLAREWQPWLDHLVPILLDVPQDSPSPPRVDIDLATDFVRCELTFVGADRLPLADQVVRWWVRPDEFPWRMDVLTDSKGVARFLLPVRLNGDAWCRHVSLQGWTSFTLRGPAIAATARAAGVLRAEIRLLPVHRVRLATAEPTDVGLAVLFEDLRLDPIPPESVTDQPQFVDVPRLENALGGFRELYEFRTYRLPDELVAIPALPLRSVIHLRFRDARARGREGFTRKTSFSVSPSAEPQDLEFVLEDK